MLIKYSPHVSKKVHYKKSAGCPEALSKIFN